MVHTQLLDMDTMIKEQVVENEDGSYTIFLNSRHCFETQMKAYWHAIEHLNQKDFEKHDVDIIEQKAHKREERLQTYQGKLY
ncbi:MAG: hypothetical protein PHD70_10970 [Anaerostipes sp.]|nr:hypothetical protein [Anaerostipes sp.]